MSGQVSDGSKSSKPTYHYGRGGAGNVTAKPNQGITGDLATTPTLKSKVYTTGRGGTGNMAKNDNPEEARAAQDVDIPGTTLLEGPHHTGRGGAANAFVPYDSEKVEAKEHNSRDRTSAVKALAEKAKEAAKGKS